jgi:short-subunit dehydrogenase
MELRNAVAVVTGASRGIGVHIAEALARAGADLALAARSEEALGVTRERIEKFGGGVISVPTDVTDMSDVENLVERASTDLGPIDIVVNNAGVERYEPFESYDVDMIARIMQTNVVSAQWLTRLVLPGMVERRRGHIVNIASVAGKMAVPYNSVYAASKHALVGFSWSLREEMAKHGVGVSVVCPGFVAEAGMFSDWSKGRKPPGLAQPVAPERVAEATVAAITKNKGEIIVSSPVMKLTKAAPHALTGWIGRRSGGFGFIEKVAVPAWRDRDEGS